MIVSFLWYFAGLLILVGVLCVVKPIGWLRLRTRRRAAMAAVAGVLLAAATLFVGTGTSRVSTPLSQLDAVFPVFQFREAHVLDIDAPADRVYKALFEVTPEEITGYRTLTWIRCLGRCGGDNIMNPTSRTPILESALKSFRRLAERPNEELVFGGFVAAPAGTARRTWTTETFVGLTEPGFAKVAMNFRLAPLGDRRTRLDTETRVQVTDAWTLRVFAAYWRTIYPGSAIIRRSWLRAIKARAEG